MAQTLFVYQSEDDLNSYKKYLCHEVIFVG